MKKRIMYLLMGMSVMAMVGGCGKTPETEEPQNVIETEQVSQELDSGGKKITITWLNHMQEEGKKAWVEFVVKKFEEENPNIKVNVETVGADSYVTILQTKIASDDAPAVFDLYTNEDVRMYNESGYLYDLSDIENVKNVEEQLLPSGQIGGVQLAVPMETSGYGVFYNKAIFEQYGISEPKTLTELYQICELLQGKGIQPFAAPMAELWALKLYVSTVNDLLTVQSDTDWYVKKEKLESNFKDDEKFKQAMEVYYSLKPYWGDDPFGTSWDNAQDLVANGKAAMLIHGSWAVDGILSKNPDCNVGIFPIPVSEHASDAKIIKEPGTMLACFKCDDPEVQEAGARLFNTIFSEEAQKNYAEGAKQIPAVTGAYEMLEPLKIIMEYPEEQSFVKSGISQFTNEYSDLFYETVSEVSMNDTLDMEVLCNELDKQFSVLVK